jgi:pimeloyl-ACP methyl ester carboxylesterase
MPLLFLPLAMAVIAPWHAAQLDGAKVRYQSYGTGKTAVVLVHGWTCDASFWEANIPALAAKYRVIALDLPGHGGSDRPKIDYTMEYLARGVDAVLADAGVERAVLVGHSMGVLVIRQYLTDHKNKVAGLILVDGPVRRPVSDEQIRKNLAAQAEYRAALAGPDFAKAAGPGIDGMFIDQTPAAMREEIKRKMLSTPGTIAASLMAGMASSTAWNDGPTDVPTLDILRKRPTIVETEAVARTQFTNLEFHAWDDVGHFLMMEQPDRFNRTVLEFLQRIGF